MAIPAVNAIYPNGGPTASNQVISSGDGQPFASLDFSGFGVAILDGAATTFTLNWVDGTATLLSVPTGVMLFRSDPSAWTALSTYPTNYLVLGSGHVQQAQNAGKTASSAPAWSTSGGSVTDGTVVWKDLGALALSTISMATSTALTNLGITATISAAGTSTNALSFVFKAIH